MNPPEPEALFADIQKARAEGYAVAVEETLPGVSTLSAPIKAAGADLVATLSLTSPSSRLTPESIDALLPELIATARSISADLGHLPPRKRRGRSDGEVGGGGARPTGRAADHQRPMPRVVTRPTRPGCRAPVDGRGHRIRRRRRPRRCTA